MIATLLALVAFVLVVAGIALISVPAALVIAGVLVGLAAYAVAYATHREEVRKP